MLKVRFRGPPILVEIARNRRLCISAVEPIYVSRTKLNYYVRNPSVETRKQRREVSFQISRHMYAKFKDCFLEIFAILFVRVSSLFEMNSPRVQFLQLVLKNAISYAVATI